MGWGDERKIDGGFWGKSYIERENFDGSKTVYEEGIFGGKGAEVGRETTSIFGGVTHVESGGGTTDVYSPTIFGPDLGTSAGISRALGDAANNTPKSAPAAKVVASAPIASGISSGVSYSGGGYSNGPAISLPTAKVKRPKTTTSKSKPVKKNNEHAEVSMTMIIFMGCSAFIAVVCLLSSIGGMIIDWYIGVHISSLTYCIEIAIGVVSALYLVIPYKFFKK